MDQHEPVLVLAPGEVLDHPDIVERERGGLVDAGEIVEHIARIGQQRRLAEPVGNGHDRAGQVGGQVVRRCGLAPDIGLDQEGIAHHRRADLLFRSILRPVLDPRIGQAVQEVANPAAADQAGQVLRRFEDRVERGGQGDLVKIESGEVPPLARQSIVSQVHGFLLAGRGFGRPDGFNCYQLEPAGSIPRARKIH